MSESSNSDRRKTVGERRTDQIKEGLAHNCSDYSYVKPLGSGAFGLAYLLKRKSDQKQYVGKAIYYASDVRIQQMALSEATALKSLKHENIVQCGDCYEVPMHQFVFIIMEFCAGGDLSLVLEDRRNSGRGRFEADIVWNWCFHMFSALEYMHGRSPKVLHRDLKPANIFLTQDLKTLKLGDFGLARPLATVDMASTYCGTPLYFSPELLRGGNYNHKVDVWAAGCCVYEMIELEHLAIVDRFEESITLKPMPKSYDKDLVSIIQQMVRINPDERPEMSIIVKKAALAYANSILKSKMSKITIDLTPRGGSVKKQVKSDVKQVRIQVVIGLSTDASVEQKVCHINLDRKDTVSVISSTPSWIGPESASCVINNVLYAVGIGSAYNELWKWSAERDEWTRLADLPSGRRRHCATSLREKIYVLGGWVDADRKTLDSVLCYDINSNKWTQVTPLCYAVKGAACVAYKTFIYIFGGTDNNDKNLNCVQMFNLSKGVVTLNSSPMPTAQSLMRAVLWRSKALLIGHYTSYIYDFELKSWEERKTFKTGVTQFGLILNDEMLYISGGGTRKRDDKNQLVWTFSDEVKSLSVGDFISDNQQAEWKHHAKLPRSALIQSFNSQSLSR